MQEWKLFLFFIGMLFAPALEAQKLDSTLAIYRSDFQTEKVHLHFDKTAYNKGETVWFKAYIVAGENLSDYSRNFFVDWYNDLGQLIKHTVHPIFESSARGQFDIPSNYKGGILHVKAYTRWMLNFDTALLFHKDIQITNTNSNATAIPKASAVTLKFFPESGDLINGINATLAFMATNQNGQPVAVKGAIVNSANQLVDSFASVHDGMGSLNFEPSANEQYTCNWMDEYGTSHSNSLPISKANGVVVSAKLVNKKAVFVVSRSTDVASNLKGLQIVATMNQQLLYNASINLNSKKTIAGEIPVQEMPTGILQLTVFDASWIPVAERILFVNNNQHQFFPELTMVTKRLSKRAKNTMELFVADTALSNLSISVTDASLLADSSSNIISQLLLSSELKGSIYRPAYYFSNESDTVAAHLDLVMLTHGWRRYKWDEIIQGQLPKLTYPMDSDYVQIKGKVFTAGQAIRSTQTITLVMQAKDSSKQYFQLPVKRDGSFNQRGIIFFDTARIFYQLNGDKSLHQNASTSFQYGLPLVPYAQAIKSPTKILIDSILLKRNSSFYAGIEKVKKSMDSAVVLKEVTVESKIKSVIDILDEKYTTGLFNNKNSYSFDVANDDRAHGSLDVFHYLQNLIPGMTMSLPTLGTNGAEDANSNNVAGLNWRDGTPDIFLNEMPSDAGAVQAISMSDVAYIKVFRPPFMAASGSGASGAIAIYTLKGAEAKNYNVKGLNSALISGYTAYKEFYSPDYTITQPKYQDSRATLYWNPYVLTDKKNKTVKLEFFNNDITSKFRIIIEGVNAFGKLAHLEKIVE
ncbi:MAG: hypothetical protein WCG74_00885 [Sediminibacterium sp.]